MDRMGFERLYTKHGRKMAQGILLEINGEKALACFEGQRIVGYTTLDEINREIYTKDLPKCNLNF